MRAAAITPAEPADARVARFSTDGSLPRYSGGSASALPVSRPAQRSLALRPAWSLSHPRRPVTPKCFSRSRYLLQPLRLLPAGATVAGRDSHPQGDGAFPRRTVESRTGAPALGSGGLSGAFAPGLSPAPVAAFPVPAHQTGRAGFPHPAFGRDHAFACRRPLVLGDRRVRPYSSRSLVSGKRTYFPVFTLCLRQSHRRSRRTACQSTAL